MNESENHWRGRSDARIAALERETEEIRHNFREARRELLERLQALENVAANLQGRAIGLALLASVVTAVITAFVTRLIVG
jgi:hypothetical protein